MRACEELGIAEVSVINHRGIRGPGASSSCVSCRGCWLVFDLTRCRQHNAMTQRVRVHVTLPDLGSQQVWLLADLSASSKIINVKSAFSDQLGLERDPSGLELAVDGFALLDRSSASIVNPVSLLSVVSKGGKLIILRQIDDVLQ